MKYWPGYIPPAGDNPPWNKYALLSLGFAIIDNASDLGGAGGGIGVNDLANIILEDNDGVAYRVEVGASDGSGADLALMDLATVFGTMDSIYGYIAHVTSDLTWDKDLKGDAVSYNRVPIINGIWKHNTSGSPINVSLVSEALLTDNQPVANYGGIQLAAVAITFAVTDTGLCEVGVQVGTTDNGIHYPRPVEALGIVGDEASIFANVEIYKSWDNQIWYPVDKAQYNTNSWSGGEYYFTAWRDAETGAAGEKGRVVAFAQPETANYFKLVYNNSAGQQIRIHEIFAFNHQIDIGFTTDFINFRYPIATRNSDSFQFDLYNEPVYRVGLGSVAPSGEYPTMDAATGLWHDYKTNSWYDYQFGSYVKADGTVWNSSTNQFVSLSSYKADVLLNPNLELTVPTSTTDSIEKDTAANMIKMYIRPYVVTDVALHEWQYYRGEMYNNPLLLNTANENGVKVSHMKIPATPGGTGAVEDVRIYNDSDEDAVGLQIHVDPDGLHVVDTETVPAGVNSFYMTDTPRNVVSPYHCWNIMNAAHDDLGSLGDSSFDPSGGWNAWTEVLPAAPPVGLQYAIDYSTGQVTTGNVTPAGSFMEFHYFSEGASATKISETGAGWTDAPAVLTYAAGSCAAGSYLILKVRSDLTNFAQEKDRSARIVPRWSY